VEEEGRKRESKSIDQKKGRRGGREGKKGTRQPSRDMTNVTRRKRKGLETKRKKLPGNHRDRTRKGGEERGKRKEDRRK